MHGLADSSGLGEQRLHLLDAVLEAADVCVGLVAEPAHAADDVRGVWRYSQRAMP